MDERPHTSGKLVPNKYGGLGCGPIGLEPFVLRSEGFDGCHPFSGGGDFTGAENEANRARVMACWNACSGMADPQATITALVGALRAFYDEDMDYNQAREQARAALALVPPAHQGEQ